MQLPEVFTFLFILRQPYSPNGKRHLDHNASIDADFLDKKPFGVSGFAKEILGVIFAPNLKKNSLLLQKHEILE
jgi:hypothetical protein